MENNTLSTSQLKILALVAVGYEDAEISEVLSISLQTVKSEIDIILSKIGASNSLQATFWAAMSSSNPITANTAVFAGALTLRKV